MTGAEIAALVRRTERRRERLLLGITAPAIAFMLVFFVLPIGFFLFHSVDNPEVHGSLPQTVTALRQWDRATLPAEPAFAALIADLRALRGKPELAILARRLNYDIAGFRTVIIRSARLAEQAMPPLNTSM